MRPDSPTRPEDTRNAGEIAPPSLSAVAVVSVATLPLPLVVRPERGGRFMLLRGCASRLSLLTLSPRLSPQLAKAMFVASSRSGRSLKILLFGLGVVLPLGSLIWALLILHGRSLAPTEPAPDDS